MFLDLKECSGAETGKASDTCFLRKAGGRWFGYHMVPRLYALVAFWARQSVVLEKAMC